MKFSIPGFFATALFLLLCAGAVHAGTIDTSLQSALATTPPGKTVPVIVTFDPPEAVTALAWSEGGGKRERALHVVRALHARAERSQGTARNFLRERGKNFRPLWIINGLTVEAEPALVKALAKQPGVREILPVTTFQLPEVQTSRVANASWNLRAVRAPEVWSEGITGVGATVAVIDSGVDVTHPLLSGKWLGGQGGWFNAAGCSPGGCTPCETNSSVPCDGPSGHGTSVAGVILGGDGTTVTGVAPGAKWVAAKIFRDNGESDSDKIIRALQWVLDPDGNPGTNDVVATIVNSSWGFDPGLCVEEVRAAVQALRAAGIPVVFAAGNGGPAPGTSASPASYSESIAVGALEPGLSLAEFSARGPSTCDGSVFPEVVAPGVDILSTSGPDVTFHGTSFSAPHLSGVLALLREAAPGVPATDLSTAAIRASADLGPRGVDNGFGFGLVDALAALRRVRGEPHMGVHDPAAPENDGRLSFGSLFPGLTATRVLTVYNQGGGSLGVQVSSLGGATPQAFAVSGNGCAGVSLPPEGACTLTLTFTPPTLGNFSGRLTLTPSAQPPFEVTIDGNGRNVPVAPQLLSPADGALTGPSVTFRWLPGVNPDGQGVTDELVVSRSPSFIGRVAAADLPPERTLLAGAGGLLASLAALRLRSRRRAAPLLAALVFVVLAACGGGSDKGGEEAGGSSQEQPGVARTVSGLTSGETYFWKVVSRNAAGGVTESEVRSFTVQVQ